MARHGVRHPVIVDERHRIWESYAIRSWPTLAVVHPDGTLLTTAPGEADLDALDAHLRDRLTKFKVPRYYEVVGELPHTATRRLAKHKLPRDRTPGEVDMEARTDD